MPGCWNRKASCFALAVAVALACHAAHAQRLIAAATAMSALREAARVYMHSVDMDLGEALPGAAWLPGTAMVGPMVLSPDGTVVAGSGEIWTGGDFEARHGETFLSAYRASPFAALPELCRGASSGWREWVGCLAAGPDASACRLVVLGTRPGADGAMEGRATLLSWKAAAFGPASPGVLWSLPGRPVAAVPLGSMGRVAVLCQDAERGPALVVGDALSEKAPLRRIGVGEEDDRVIDAVASGLAVSRDGAHLFIMVSGFTLDQLAGETVSWVHVLDTARLEPACDPVELPGESASAQRSLYPVGDAGCWAATRVPGTDFAYATRLAKRPGALVEHRQALVKDRQYALAGAARQFHLACAPVGEDLAVALDNRLEIWAAGQRGGLDTVFEDDIGVLLWSTEGIVVGEGGRIHTVDFLTGTALRTVQLQSGWVTAAVVAPAALTPARDTDGDGLSDAEEGRRGTSPHSPDTDGDGIPDGSDPEPLVPTPRIEATPSIVFHGDAAGRELRALRVCVYGDDTAAWRITYDPAALPWLRLRPQSGRGPGYAYMGVDPACYVPEENATGTLSVTLAAQTAGHTVDTQPAVVRVRIAPARSALRRILWVWPERGNSIGDGIASESAATLRDPSDFRGFRALADLLAGPPHYFVHRETAGAFQGPLAPYTVVVLGAEAVAQGAITGQAILEYVARGGALLFLGAHLGDEPNRVLARWFLPLGIQIDTAAHVDGQFPALEETGLAQHWRSISVEGGCGITAPEDSVLVADDHGHGLLVARGYGYGRIALLAGASPLQGGALGKQSQRLFASDLFQWLAHAGRDVEDMDGDGLPDGLEDANNNGSVDAHGALVLRGTVDPGETDWLNPDTDGDGLPDGLEDANRNGVVDEGETDPRNPDSDGDGIFDGADSTPSPVFGAPRIGSVLTASRIAEGPAEGGTLVSIFGRNFTPDSVFWFGDGMAAWSRVAGGRAAVLQTPPFARDEGGDVPIRVVSAGGALEGVLPKGFHYTPRTKVRLVLQPVGSLLETEAGFEGTLAILFEAAQYMALGRIILAFEAEPFPGFAWFEATPGESVRHARRRMDTVTRKPGFLVVNIATTAEGGGSTLGGQLQMKSGELLRVRWRRDAEAWTGAPLRVRAVCALILTGSGGRLDVSVDPLVILLSQDRPAVPRPQPERTVRSPDR